MINNNPSVHEHPYEETEVEANIIHYRCTECAWQRVWDISE